ncbi:type 1 glutamine amidotransferase [Chelatococcus sp. SYSU_G07232]|uniref:Type 1 glutamine amidotransferase n=1 Tax=Chelatococcus albus TaxID=3047466 RepID=A0ABT7AHC2_9HYPH|nr:type 1 glutamine amidotransferase [Chelatococcus sp. SYSU_G07232]MDJ1158229.1 type 1 glutamine amidotransferase [Chelatococcus sp. SYSU_G07232]
MALRFLVVEGNTRDGRAAHKASFGATYSESYAATLQAIMPDAVCDLCFPADEGANLPTGEGLASYDGIVVTGSALHAYDPEPAVARQIELMRAVYASGTPSFGSCWGLQVATVAAYGTVAVNPQGREVGIARRIVRTADGQGHALLAGRPEAFDAPAVHLDAVAAVPEGAIIVAKNDVGIQAAEIRHDGGLFWGVQYHPEFSLAELAAILGRMTGPLVAEGFCRSEDDVRSYVADLLALDREPTRGDLAWRHGLDAQVLDPLLRTTEIRNFVRHRVLPAKSERGRA